MYVTVNDIISRFDQNELAKMTGGTTIDTTMVGQIIDAVESLVHTVLKSAGYVVPMAVCPPVLIDVICYLVIKRIYARKISVTEIPDGIRAMFDWAENFLKGLLDGSIRLDLPPGMLSDSISVSAGKRPDVKKYTDEEYSNAI